ncbi:MAG TPA: hypothetical protein VI540_09665 [Gaiellaceae bacterium]|nr:hypothetical protein [Gaiellaceae bacterium]
MRRNRVVAALAAVIVVVVVVVVLVLARGDDGGPSEETVAWAGSICSSLTEWQSSIESIANVAATGLSKESLANAFDDAAQATDELVADLKALDSPDIETGDELKRRLDQSVDELSSDYESLKAEAEDALDADSTAELLGALASLAPRFQALIGGVGEMLETLQSEDVVGGARDELEQAFEDAESCRELRGEPEPED